MRQQSVAAAGSSTNSSMTGNYKVNQYDVDDEELDQSPLKKKPFPTNYELAKQRDEVSRAKRRARLRSHQNAVHKNYRLKELIEQQQKQQFGDARSMDDATNASAISRASTSTLYALKVTLCSELRRQIKLRGRDKRGRVFVEANSDAVLSLDALKRELSGSFHSLRKNDFVLCASYPMIAADGSIIPPMTSEKVDDDADAADKNDNNIKFHNNNDDFDSNRKFWNIESDRDLQETFAKADKYYHENRDSNILKRPSLVILIKRNPNAPPPSPPPSYLVDMPDPSQTPSMTMLSFYSFPPGDGIPDPHEFANQLRKQWQPFQVLGRVYVAMEGVNAQMACPTNVLPNFMKCCESIPELAYIENGINVDPVVLSKEEFATAGTPAEGGQAQVPPFRTLHIRVRSQVVADGLDKTLDWQSAGYDMPPLEWHETVRRIQQQRNEKGSQKGYETTTTPIILDCRNSYETDVGIFEGAESLGTHNFRDSWDVLHKRLTDVPKDAPIMTYCTGGIRCVKQARPDEPSQFKGTNFVFDGRLGRPITEDSMGVCITCGSETSLVSNCRNGNCHKRMIQCETCQTNYHGTCSNACRNRLLHGSVAVRTTSKTAFLTGDASGTKNEQDCVFRRKTSAGGVFVSLDEYSAGQSTPPPSLYREMEYNTKALIPSGSHMVSGEMQGRLLKQLASMARNGRILELGTFTGYSTACLLEGACQAAQSIRPQSTVGSLKSGPYVMSMERDDKAFDVAVAQMQLVSRYGFGEEAAEALCALRSCHGSEDAPSVPRISNEVVNLNLGQDVGCDLIHTSDALAILEEMAAGRGQLAPGTPFDLVFVDADKTRLYEYANACLSSDVILHKGGLIVVDNVLWKGLVLGAAAGNNSNNSLSRSSSSDVDDDDDEQEKSDEIYEQQDQFELNRRNRRARKLANKMHRFNTAIACDIRAEVLVLPLRDGLSIIRKK
ncbi:hypothetical protein ACA910_021055 [Epithemia clementina (nom. ined.)]